MRFVKDWMFWCYFESKAYTKDVMVKNQHFRCYHENKEIEYFQKFKSFMHFNSVCDVPRASITAWQRLRILLISLLILYCGIWSHSSRRACLSSCTDAGCTGRDETAVCNISQACSIGFRSGDLAGHSIRTIVACSRYWLVMRALCACALSSIRMKFSTTAPGRT